MIFILALSLFETHSQQSCLDQQCDDLICLKVSPNILTIPVKIAVIISSSIIYIYYNVLFLFSLYGETI